MVRPLVVALLTATLLMGSVSVASAYASADFDKGMAALTAGNVTEAVKWWRKAAGQRHATAQYNLGVMYGKGLGVMQDYITAHMWWDIAASKGNKDAMKNRDIIAKRMSATGVEEAQKRKHLCLKSNYKRCD